MRGSVVYGIGKNRGCHVYRGMFTAQRMVHMSYIRCSCKHIIIWKQFKMWRIITVPAYRPRLFNMERIEFLCSSCLLLEEPRVIDYPPLELLVGQVNPFSVALFFSSVNILALITDLEFCSHRWVFWPSRGSTTIYWNSNVNPCCCLTNHIWTMLSKWRFHPQYYSVQLKKHIL